MKLSALIGVITALLMGCGASEEDVRQQLENERFRQEQEDRKRNQPDPFEEECKAAGGYYHQMGDVCDIETETESGSYKRGAQLPQAASESWLKQWYDHARGCRARKGRLVRPVGCYVKRRDGSELLVKSYQFFPFDPGERCP